MFRTASLLFVSLCLYACGDDSDAPSGSQGGAQTSGATGGTSASAESGTVVSGVDGSGEATAGTSASFFRFDATRDGQTFSIDVPCTFPFIPIPGDVNFSGRDPEQGLGIQLVWDAAALPTPGTYEINPVLILFNGGSKGLRVTLDQALNLTVVEADRWAGQIDSLSFSDENDMDLVLVENVAFDCRLE